MLLESKPKEIAPAGTHTAILYSIVDMGTQTSDYNGEVKIQPKISFTWELCDEKMKDGRPFSASKWFTLSAHPKSVLAVFLKSWLGQEVEKRFDLNTLLGRACNLTIVHNTKPNGDVSASVSGVAPLKKNEKAPQQHNANFVFEMTPPENFKADAFNALPEFMQNAIKNSPEYVEAINYLNGVSDVMPPKQIASDLNDSIPF